MSAPTPYNFIYTTILPATLANKRPCCLHGENCPENDDESSAYVNLMPTRNKKALSTTASMNEMSERKQKDLRRVTRTMKALQLEGRSNKTRSEEKKKREVIDIGELDQSQQSRTNSWMSSKRGKRKEKPFDTLDNLAAVAYKKLVRTAYLGVMTWKEAEAAVPNNTDFRLYHRMGKATIPELEPSLPLFIVYKSASGKLRHYRVRTQVSHGVTTYVVEYGDPNAVVHPSLEHLVRFYHTQFFSHQKDNQQLFDAFWSDSE